jgi:hypothetical protein
MLIQNLDIQWMAMKLTARKTMWVVLIAVLLTTAACSKSPTAPTTTDLTIFFPQQEAVNGEREVMEALIFGTLAVAENCIRVNASESDTSYLLIWPPDYTLSVENDAIQILNGSGQVVTRVGDKARISGGEVKSEIGLDEQMRKKLPPNCLAPYWIVGDEVNTIEMSEETR